MRPGGARDRRHVDAGARSPEGSRGHSHPVRSCHVPCSAGRALGRSVTRQRRPFRAPVGPDRQRRLPSRPENCSRMVACGPQTQASGAARGGCCCHSASCGVAPCVHGRSRAPSPGRPRRCRRRVRPTAHRDGPGCLGLHTRYRPAFDTRVPGHGAGAGSERRNPLPFAGASSAPCSLRNKGLWPLVEEISRRRLTADQAGACLGTVWLSSILETVMLTDPRVGAFDGTAHLRTVSVFAAADRDHIGSTAVRVRQAVAENATRTGTPTPGNQTSSSIRPGSNAVTCRSGSSSRQPRMSSERSGRAGRCHRWWSRSCCRWDAGSTSSSSTRPPRSRG